MIGNDSYDWQPDESGEYRWVLKKMSMFKQYSTSLHDYWFIEIKPTYRRYKYGFLLNDGMEEQLFIERAFFNVNDETVLKDVNGFFDFPYLNPEDVFQPLKWVKETKWYQIFPE